MANVSVESAAVSGAISLCKQSVEQFQQASRTLTSRYQTAGSTWKDSKYTQLGGIVNDCSIALNKPIKELEDCARKLNELLRAIQEYESTSL